MKKLEIKSVINKPYKEKPVRFFKSNPLDVQLAAMQEKLLNRIISINNYSEPLIEEYIISENYRDEVYADKIKLVYCNTEDNEQYVLKLIVNNPSNTIETHCIAIQGVKNKIIELLQDEGLFLDLKNDVLNICKTYKDSD